MQIILFITISIGLIVFLIYTINKKFGLKELFILLAVLIIPIVITIFYLNKTVKEVPEIFKEKYEKEKSVTISKLSFKRLNNKDVSSSKNFIYDFDYIITKNGKESVCSTKEVKIKKIEDVYVFENFENLNEKCTAK